MPDVVLSRHNVGLPNTADQLLPSTPTVSYPTGPVGGANPATEYANLLGSFNKDYDATTGQLNVPFASPLTPALRYEDPEIGYHPFDDKLEYKYADAHPWQTAGNNLLQFGARFGGAFLESIATIPIAVGALMEGDSSKLYDNDLTNGISDWLEDLNRSLPTYRTQYEEEHPIMKFLNPLKFTSWMGAIGGAVNNLGYTAGAIAGALATDVVLGAMTGGIGLGPAFAAQGARLSKGIQALTKAVTKGDDIARLGAGSIDNIAAMNAERGVVQAEMGAANRGQKLLGEGNQMGVMRADGTGQFQAGGQHVDQLLGTGVHARDAAVNTIHGWKKLADGTRYQLGLLTSAAAEGAFEAVEVYHRGVDELKMEFHERYGRDPLGEEMAQIERTAKEASNTTMGANIALLYVSNRVNWGGLFASTEQKMLQGGITGWGKGIARTKVTGKLDDVLDAGKNVVDKKFTYAVDSIKPTSRIGKIMLNGEKLAKIGSRSINEGLEEAAQFTIGEGTLQYVKDKYDPYVMNETASLLKGLKDGADKTFTTNEGWDNIMGGFVGGILGGAAMGRIQRKTPLTEQMQRQVQLMNSATINGVLAERFKDATAQTAIGKRHAQAVREKDIFAAKNTHFDMLFNWVNSGIKANAYERRILELDLLRNLKGDDFQAKWGMEDNEANRNKANSFLDGMKTKAEMIKKDVEKVRYITKNPFKPSDIENYTAYESYKDELSHNLSAFREYQGRINEMTGDLKKHFPLLDVKKAVNLTSVEGLSRILKELNKTTQTIAGQLRDAQEDPALTETLTRKKEAIDSIYNRVSKIVQSGNIQTSKNEKGETTLTGRTDNVDFNGDDFLSALNDLYDLHNGTSFESSRYIQRYADNAESNNNIIDITDQQQTIDDDVKADLLEKLQDIYKLSDANYNIGKYYTYLRKGVGQTEFDRKMRAIRDEARAKAFKMQDENYAKDREEAIRAEEVAAIVPEEGDEEMTPEEEKVVRSAAKKAAKKQPLTKEEEDIVEAKPKVFGKHKAAETRTAERMKEEKLEVATEEAESPDGETSENPQAGKSPIKPNGTVEPFSGITPHNLFGMFSQDRGSSKLRTSLHKAIFGSATEETMAGKLGAAYSIPEKISDAIIPIPGTKLFRKGFEENVTIYSGNDAIGILRPPATVFLDAAGTRSIYDMTAAEYSEMTGNQSDTYDAFMKHIKDYRESYNKLRDEVINGDEVDVNTILKYFKISVNPGSRKTNTNPKLDVKLNALTRLPTGTALLSLDADNKVTVVNSKELGARKTAEVLKFAKDNAALIQNTYRYMVVMPILGKYDKRAVIVGRNAETTEAERNELLAGIKQVASAQLSEAEANEVLTALADKFYISASRENAGLFIDFRFDEDFQPSIRLFDRSKNLVEELPLEKAALQSATSIEDLTVLINTAIRTAKGRQTSNTALSKLDIEITPENIKRQIPDNKEVEKLADLGDVMKLATDTADIFVNFNLEFTGDESVKAAVTPSFTAATAADPAEPVSTTQFATDEASLTKILKKVFNMTPAQAKATAQVYMLKAQAWAARTGKTVDDWFKTFGFDNKLDGDNEDVLKQHTSDVEKIISGFELTPAYSGKLFLGYKSKNKLAGRALGIAIDKWAKGAGMDVTVIHDVTHGTIQIKPRVVQSKMYQGNANVNEVNEDAYAFIKAVKDSNLKGVGAQILKQAANNADIAALAEFARNIVDQANDPESVNQTIESFGKDVVEAAKTYIVDNNLLYQNGKIVIKPNDSARFARIGITDPYEIEAILSIGLQGIPFTKAAIEEAIQKEFDQLIIGAPLRTVSVDSPAISNLMKADHDVLVEDGQRTEDQLTSFLENAAMRKQYLNTVQENQRDVIKIWTNYLKESEYPTAFKYVMLDTVLNYNYEVVVDKMVKRTDKTARSITNFDAAAVGEVLASRSRDILKDYTTSMIENARKMGELNGSKKDAKGGKWIVFKGGSGIDPAELRATASSLSGFVQNSYWCTKTNAHSQLKGGDFHVYYIESNGSFVPKVAIRMANNNKSIGELKGNTSGQILEDEYVELSTDYVNKLAISEADKKATLSGLGLKRKIKTLEANLKENGLQPNTLDEVASVFNETYIGDDEYHKVEMYERIFPTLRKLVADPVEMEKIGLSVGDILVVEEGSFQFEKVFNKYGSKERFENAKIFIGNVRFDNSPKFTDAFVNSNIERIIGHLDITHVRTKNLGKLKRIEGRFNFREDRFMQFIDGRTAQLDFGELEYIGNGGTIEAYNINNLGKIKEIKGDLVIGDSADKIVYTGDGINDRLAENIKDIRIENLIYKINGTVDRFINVNDAPTGVRTSVTSYPNAYVEEYAHIVTSHRHEVEGKVEILNNLAREYKADVNASLQNYYNSNEYRVGKERYETIQANYAKVRDRILKEMEQPVFLIGYVVSENDTSVKIPIYNNSNAAYYAKNDMTSEDLTAAEHVVNARYRWRNEYARDIKEQWSDSKQAKALEKQANELMKLAFDKEKIEKKVEIAKNKALKESVKQIQSKLKKQGLYPEIFDNIHEVLTQIEINEFGQLSGENQNILRPVEELLHTLVKDPTELAKIGYQPGEVLVNLVQYGEYGELVNDAGITPNAIDNAKVVVGGVSINGEDGAEFVIDTFTKLERIVGSLFVDSPSIRNLGTLTRIDGTFSVTPSYMAEEDGGTINLGNLKYIGRDFNIDNTILNGAANIEYIGGDMMYEFRDELIARGLGNKIENNSGINDRGRERRRQEQEDQRQRFETDYKPETPFDEEEFEEVYQNEGVDKPRGAFNKVKRIIYGLTDPRIDTPLHEMAHAWEETLTAEERKIILDWAGHEKWTRATSEKFADGFTVYMSEGNKTNKPELTGLFNKFAKWLADVYKDVAVALGITLTNEMRTIYSNMLNSEFVAPVEKVKVVKAVKKATVAKLDPVVTQSLEEVEIAQAEAELQAAIDAVDPTEDDYSDIVAVYNSVHKDVIKDIKAKYNPTTEEIEQEENPAPIEEEVVEETPTEEVATEEATTEPAAPTVVEEAPKKRSRKRVSVNQPQKVDIVAEGEAFVEPQPTESDEAIEEPAEPVLKVQYVSFPNPDGTTGYGAVTEVDGNLMTIITPEGREMYRAVNKVNNITEAAYAEGVGKADSFTFKGVKYEPKFGAGNTVVDNEGKTHVIESVELVPDLDDITQIITVVGENGAENKKATISTTKGAGTATMVYTTTDGIKLIEPAIAKRLYVSGQDQKQLKDKYNKNIKHIDSLLQRLSQFFGGIRYEYVEMDFAQPARFYKGIVQINLNRIEEISRNADEILIHEFIHPFVKALQMSNRRLYDNLVKDLETNFPNVIEEARGYYKETDYVATDLIDEALTLHLGRNIATAFRQINSISPVSLLYDDIKPQPPVNGKVAFTYKGEVIGELREGFTVAERQALADKVAVELSKGPLETERLKLYTRFRNWFNTVMRAIKKKQFLPSLNKFITKANKSQSKFRFVSRTNANGSIELERGDESYITVNIDPEFVKDAYDIQSVMMLVNKQIGNTIAGTANYDFTAEDSEELEGVFFENFFGAAQNPGKNTFTTSRLHGDMSLRELSFFLAEQLAETNLVTNIEFENSEIDAFDEIEAYFKLTDPQLEAMRKRVVAKFGLLEDTAKTRLGSEDLKIQANAARKLDLDNKDDLDFMLGYMENAAVSINLAYVKYGKLMEKLKNAKGTSTPAELNALQKEFAVIRQMISYYDQFTSYTEFKDYFKGGVSAREGARDMGYYASAFANQQKLREAMQDTAINLTVEWLTPYAVMHTKLMKEQGYTDEKYEVTPEKLYQLFKYGNGRDTNYITFFLGSNVTSRDPINAIFANTLGDMLSMNNIIISQKSDDFAVAFDRFLKDKGISINSSEAQQEYFKKHYMRKAKIRHFVTDPDTKVETETIIEKWALHQEYKFDEYELDLLEESKKYKNPRSGAEADLFNEQFNAWKKANKDGKIAKYANPEYAKAKADPFFQAMEISYNDSNQRYGTNQLRFGIIPQKFEISYAEKLKRAAGLFKGKDKLNNVKDAITDKLAAVTKDDNSYNLDGSIYRHINTTLSTIKEERNISLQLDELMQVFIVESNNYSTLKETEYGAETLLLLLEGNAKLSITPRTFAQEDFNAKIRSPIELRKLQERVKEMELLRDSKDATFDPVLYKTLKDKADKGIQSYNLFDKLAGRMAPSKTDYNNQKLASMIKDRYFGEAIETPKVGKIDAVKVAHYLRLFTSINNMAGNYIAGLGNISIGNLQLVIEAHGGKYFNKRHLANAAADYTKNIPQYIADLQRPIKSKDTQLSIMLDAIQGEIENEFNVKVSGNIARQMFRTSTLFLFTKAGEHQLQITNMKAMLNGREVTTNSGEKISLYEAFTTDTSGRVSLRKDLKDFNDESLKKFMRDMHGVNRMLNGNYSDLHKTMLQRRWYGNLLLSYRKYIYPSVRARYASEHVDYERNTVEVGYFRYFMFDYLPNGMKNILTGKGGFAKFKDLKPHQQYALRKTAAELGAYGALTALAVGFFGSGDDEAKKELTEAQKFGLLMLLRLRGDIGVWHWDMPSELIKQAKSPTASLTSVVAFANVLKQLKSPFEVYEQDYGVHQEGDSKLAAKVKKLVPIVSKFQSTTDDKLGYLTLLGRNTGDFIEGVIPKNDTR